MSDWPSLAGWQLDSGGSAIGSWSFNWGMSSTSPSSNAWESANRAIFIPVRVASPCTAYKMVTGCGTGAGGNLDMGIYDRSGNRLVSTGSTARSASNEIVVDITDTRLGPGLYYLALVIDGVNTMAQSTFGASAELGRMAGLLQMASAFALPATATFASRSNNLLPWLCALVRPY